MPAAARYGAISGENWAQAQASFGLAYRHRFDACTEDFGQISAVVEAQAHDPIKCGINDIRIWHETIALQYGHEIKDDGIGIEAYLFEEAANAEAPEK